MDPHRAPLALLCLALAAPIACKESPKKDDKATAEKSKADDSKGKKQAEGDDGDDDAAKAKKKTKKSAGDGGKGADDDKAQKGQPASYDASLKTARERLGRKDYKGAIAAYDDACAARDDDALVRGERGYAKVLDKQYDDGLKDLDAALGLTDDAKLLGPIWYNIGLGREGKANPKGALEAYKKSNDLRPTKAAQGKITALGDSIANPSGVCPAKIDSKRVEAKKYASWLDLYRALAKKDGVDAPDAPPTSDAAARKELCKDGCTGKGPFLVHLGGVDSGGGVEVIALAGQGDDGKVYAWDDVGGGMMFARCGYGDDAKLTVGAPFTLVHVVSEPQELAWLDDKGNACTPQTEGCMSGCFSEHWSETTQYYDLASLVRVASVVESGKQESAGKHKPLVHCAADATGKIGVTGGGCDRLIKVDLSASGDTAGACVAPSDKDRFQCAASKKCPAGWHADPGNMCYRACTTKAGCKEARYECNNQFGFDVSVCDFPKWKP